MLRRVAIGGAALVAAWLIALVVLDGVVAAREGRMVEARVGESLQAAATVGNVEVALVRGRLDLERLSMRRDDGVGRLAIDVADLRCELAPLGWALVDHACRELAVRGVRLEVSTAALFHIKNPKRPPVRADRVMIDDAVLTFAPSAFVPSLGRISVSIEHAEAGPTVFRTPLSWLLALRELRARLDLPANIGLRLAYRDGVLSVAGTLFGSTPVALPVELPSAGLAADGHEEIQLLVKTAKDVAERLVAKRAEDWLRAKLR